MHIENFHPLIVPAGYVMRNFTRYMLAKLLIGILLSAISFPTIAQLSIKNPQICHDKDGYLRCYFDGNYLLKFANGNFKEAVAADSSFIYSDADKTFTFYSVFPRNEARTKVQLKLLPHSILVTNGALQKEFTSIPDTAMAFRDFHISTYTINKEGRGFKFWAGDDKYVTLEVNEFDNWGWEWGINVQENNQYFYITYNAYRKNRVEFVGVRDNDSGYLMSVLNNFNSLKKLERLAVEHFKEDTVTDGKYRVAHHHTLDYLHLYYYSKNGKFKKKKSPIGEMKLCDCE